MVALRKYLRRSSKSDKVDALTLAKMPFIDPEQLEEIYLPPAKIYAIQRLARQRQRLESEIGTRKKRIGSIVDGYLPGVRQAFSDSWSIHARAFLRSHLNPMAVAKSGEKALYTSLNKTRKRGKVDAAEIHTVYLACQDSAAIYKLSTPVGTIDDDFFAALQDEISRELRLMEVVETESEAIAQQLEQLYHQLHPSDNLRTIPGVGEHTAPVFLATIGDPARFRSQSAFANYNGIVPSARQSSEMEAKGLKMTKAGPSIMRLALYQSSQIGRRYDPQLAWLYYREMVHYGKNHKQAMGAVMSHIGARVLAVLRDDKPYELRDIDGRSISAGEARRLVQSKYKVPEDIKQERRRRRHVTNKAAKPGRRYREAANHRINEAAAAPQPVIVTATSQE